MELFLLRAAYSSHPLLTRLALCFALFAALHWLLTWRRAAGDAAVRGSRRQDLQILAAALGAALLLSVFGYQGRGTRERQLNVAAAAPLRVSYGDPAAPTIRVFTARGCGPCMQLESELRPFIHEGYAVQYIPGSLDDQDWLLVTAAVCGNSGAGFERAFNMAPDALAPVTGTACQGNIGGNEAVQHRLKRGRLLYPTVVMPDGLLIVGAPSLAYLRQYLQATAPLPGRPS